MVHKKFCLCCVHVILAFIVSADVYALNSADIQAVRDRILESKASLRSQDEIVINNFLRAGLDELLLEEDLWQAVNIRTEILAQSGGVDITPYGTAFITAAKKNLVVAFDDVRQSSASDRKTRMELNLLIIAAGLKSMETVDLGLKMLDSSNGTVQYWAVQTATNPNAKKQLISQVTGDENLVASIVNELQKIVGPQTYPETLRLMVDFADELDTDQSKALLVKIADLRMSQYEAWKVKYEMLDAVLLTSLGNQILLEVSPSEKADLCGKFAQLYSYVIERFVLGQKVLRPEQKRMLASAITEVEHGVISKLMGRTQNRLKKAVEGLKFSVVENERKFLLGSDTQQGQLPKTLNFDYGKTGDNAITAPKSLKAPVVPAVENKETGNGE
jgi:hypothetical protein